MSNKKRKEIFRAIVGSHNYNLNDESSDKDYKVFVSPTFDDLYFGDMYHNSVITETVDYDYHDIRKLPELFWKANVNFLEVLFSEQIEISDDNKADTKAILRAIFTWARNDLAKMNLPYLYKSCIGMHITKKKQIDKGTSGTQYLVEQFGYDTKQAMHSVRILDFLKRFADSEFNDFKSAIYYQDNDPMRQKLLDIKYGKLTKEEFTVFSDTLFNEVENKYQVIYLSQIKNEDKKDLLIKSIKDIVVYEL